MFKKENIAIFPLLSALPIVHGFSWGEEAPNMSEAYSDPNLVEIRVSGFLKTLGANASSIVVKINPNNNPLKDRNVMEITKKLLKRKFTDSGEVEVYANTIFTKLKDVVLTVKPADCAICILYFENELREKFVGLIHCSAKETDELLPRKTIEYLKKNYLVDPATIKIGITPAISKEYFYVNPGEISEDNWNGFMQKKNDLIFLDIIGNVRNQLEGSGIQAKNIQYFDVDTFASALVGKTFSHRMAEDLGLPNGRYIVAVGLNSGTY